jgi:hypothetical protein
MICSAACPRIINLLRGSLSPENSRYSMCRLIMFTAEMAGARISLLLPTLYRLPLPTSPYQIAFCFPHLSAAFPEASSSSSGEDGNQALTMNEMMRRHIISVLRLTDGRIEGRGGTAEILDMKPSTLRARMKKLGIRIEKNYRTIH